MTVARASARCTRPTPSLTDAEYTLIVERLGREPEPGRAGHPRRRCGASTAATSTRAPLLKRLPTTGPRVVQGPGENAGAVDIGDGLLCVLKMESHNHPSAVEPFQGAATGVGGILRDIFTMGARPIAMLDSLRFGPLDEARNRYLFDGVVAGIGALRQLHRRADRRRRDLLRPELRREPAGQRDVRRPRASASG